MSELSLQERYAPTNACFGCGPVNAQGLRIRSFFVSGVYVAEWQPQPHHEAFPGVLNGGIIGALFDCHMNWASAHHLMQRAHQDAPPSTVTAEFSVKLLRPTSTAGPVSLRASIVDAQDDRAIVEATLDAGGRTCATGRGVFVAIQPGHPAYHRW